MGQSFTKYSILVLGMKNSGKTRFINLLQFQDDCTYLGPTNGKNIGIYKHVNSELVFTELGGQTKSVWGRMIGKETFDAVYFFINSKDNEQEMQQSYSYLLHLISINKILPKTPVVIIIYVGEKKDQKREGEGMDRAQKCLQLKLMSDTRPLLLTQLVLYNRYSLANFINHLLDWTIEKIP
jgi:GTPase SAR1 family protein